MERLRKMMFVAGTTFVVTGLCVAVVSGDEAQDAKCVTLLNPATCQSAASSYCNSEAEDGTCNGGTCWTCDASTAMPNTACVRWEGETCSTSGDFVSCGPSDAWEGECGMANGTCVCANMQRTGPCENTGTFPCE
jgi:hypothetical protein